MTESKKPDRAQIFVTYVLERCAADKGFAARLRRADNPDTEYQSYGILVPFVDITKNSERRPFALIGAALARLQNPKNGKTGLGRALKNYFEGKDRDNPGEARLRRLLACSSQAELCRILRSLLTLLKSQDIDYVRLLRQVLYFYNSAESTKLQWAQEFYAPAADAKKSKEGA
jgi:CRISPR system Cascade subunit CasB